MVWDALASIGGSIISGATSAWGAAAANREARAASRRQMEFQERMQRNRYRYTMEDMRAAGLNPILAYQQGGGGAPSGASYTPQNIGAGAASALSSGINSAINARMTGQQMKLIRSQIKNVEQDTKKKLEETNTTAHHGAEALSRTKINNQTYHSAKAAAEGAKHLEEIYKGPMGPVLRYIEAFSRAAQPAASAAANVGRAATARPPGRRK